jgi:hypothetical protein
MRRTDLVGKTFGRLTVVHRMAASPAKYICECSCGKSRRVLACNLTQGNTRSCGCLRLELLHAQKMEPVQKRVNEMGRYYRANASRRGIPWNLTMGQFKRLVMKPCTYCGDTKVPMGIDRRVSGVGYVYKNCSPCCRWCNQAKSNRTVKQFKEWVRRVYGRVFRR